MAGNRIRRYFDAACVLGCEVVAFAFLLRASTLLGTVDFSHLGRWLQSTSPVLALTSMFRLLGLAISGWLLLSTSLYAAAALSGKRGAIAKSRLITLPALRRVIDSVVVASVTASSIGSAAAVSGATPASHITTIARPIAAARPGPNGQVRARSTSSAVARVSATALGRHFPHPGHVDHLVPEVHYIAEKLSEVPSEQNGFAGLPRGTKVVVVQPGDCLSVLAEHHLGDWRLDSEIEALNYGRLQADGRTLVDDHWIYVGWVLVMPQNAVGTIVVGGSTATRPPEDTTTPAEHKNPQRSETPAEAVAPRQAEPAPVKKKAASSPTTTRSATTTTPTTTTPSTSTPTTSTPTISATAAITTRASATSAAPTANRVSATTTSAGTDSAASRMPIPNTATNASNAPPSLPSPAKPSDPPHEKSADSAANKEDNSPEHARQSDSAGLVLAAGIGAIAGAGIVWTLDRSRRRFGHWRPKNLPVPRNKPDVEAAERRARAIASPEKGRWVDQAIRYLSGLMEEISLDGGAPPPSLVLLRVGVSGLEVFLSPVVTNSLGWFAPTEDGTTLLLDADVTLEELETLAGEHWPAWPAVVTLGETDEGELLLNLEYAGSVSVEGPDNLVRGLLDRMLLELATQRWSDEMLAGLYAIGGPSSSTVPGVQKVDRDNAFDLAERLDVVSGAQQELAATVPISALRAMACEALPNVVVAFAGTPLGALQCLAEAATPEKSGVAMAGAGTFEGARWKVVLSSDGQASVEGQLAGSPVSFPFRVKCDPEEVALLGEALGGVSTNHDANGGTTAPGPAELTENDPMNSGTNGSRNDATTPEKHVSGPELLSPQRGEVEICVLGPVDITGGDMSALEPSRRMAALALLAYMAAHDRPITADEIAGALWPLDATKDDINGPQRKTVMNVLSRARAVLGYTAAGKERIVYSPQGYRLAGDVTSDWARFEKYVANARRQSPDEAMTSLRSALELVRGEPFGGVLSSQFFEWVASEHLDMTFSAKAVDAAQDLGQFALDLGDLEGVVWAVEKGLQLEPTREELFVLWMHALGRQGRPAKVDDVYRRLKLVIRQRLDPLQEPRPETREVWRLYTAAELSNSQG